MFRNVSRSGTSIPARSPSNTFNIFAAHAILPPGPPHGTRHAKLACPGASSPAPREERLTTFKDLIRRVKSEVHEVSPEEARAMAGGGAVIVDVREADEWVQGHIPGALFIPRGFLELRIEEKVPDKSHELVLQCAGGTRSALAAKAL